MKILIKDIKTGKTMLENDNCFGYYQDIKIDEKLSFSSIDWIIKQIITDISHDNYTKTLYVKQDKKNA